MENIRANKENDWNNEKHDNKHLEKNKEKDEKLIARRMMPPGLKITP